MKITRYRQFRGLKHQQGVTLIELLVAGLISLIAVSGMLLVMATSLGTTTQTIEMTRLTQEMRTGMQIMTRELRRANYHPNFIACYGDTSCLGTLGINNRIQAITISDNTVDAGANDCFWFWYDRPQICPTSSCTAAQLDAAQVAVTAETVAGFRRATTAGVGKLQMTTTITAGASCSTSTGWVDITDPNIIDVLSFTVVNNDAAFPSITETINTAGDTQNVEKIGLTMTAKLTADSSVAAWIQNLNSAGATRDLNAFVKVRNHVVTPAP